MKKSAKPKFKEMSLKNRDVFKVIRNWPFIKDLSIDFRDVYYYN